MSEKVEKKEQTEEKVEEKEEEKKEQEKDEIDEVLEELKEEEKPTKEKEKYIIIYKERKPKPKGLPKQPQQPQEEEKGMDWGFIALLIGLLLLSIIMIFLLFSGGF
jgi:hypothetical protein